jgi:hypothetical protein
MNPTEIPIKDIHLPEPVSWWPPAIGWWILAVLIPIVLVLLVWLYKWFVRKTPLKAAKKYLATIKEDASSSDYEKLCELSVLVRRTAISYYPRSETAGLIGKQWLDFLDKPMKDHPFSEGVGQLLMDAPYRKTHAEDLRIGELIQLCEDWLKALPRKKK